MKCAVRFVPAVAKKVIGLPVHVWEVDGVRVTPDGIETVTPAPAASGLP